MKTRLKFAVILGLLMPTAVQANDNRIDRIRPDAPALAAYGEHKIGVRTVSVTNPDQIDILKVEAGKTPPRYDRPLTLEIWYPAETDKTGGDYRILLRDGKTEATVSGQAVRDAAPKKENAKYPLILISHGYPGNRYLMSHLGENLASKGYVAVAIDHKDSTYDDKQAFGSTLVNRTLDQIFVLNAVAKMADDESSFLSGIVDASNTGLIGYSMGGYGAVITAGGGVTETAVGFDWGAPEKTLAIHQAGSDSHAKLFDPRIKATIAIAPWGMQRGFWDKAGLAEVKIPMLFMAGDQDDVSDYQKGIRPIFDGTTGVERYLLTFAGANHNAAAPIPAPAESWNKVEGLDFIPFDHYADPVWDTVRMNNITQHFATAFFAKYLRGDSDKASYLTLIEDAEAGVYAANEDGSFKPEHTYWKGFPDRTAKALRFEHRLAGQ